MDSKQKLILLGAAAFALLVVYGIIRSIIDYRRRKRERADFLSRNGFAPCPEDAATLLEKAKLLATQGSGLRDIEIRNPLRARTPEGDIHYFELARDPQGESTSLCEAFIFPFRAFEREPVALFLGNRHLKGNSLAGRMLGKLAESLGKLFARPGWEKVEIPEPLRAAYVLSAWGRDPRLFDNPAYLAAGKAVGLGGDYGVQSFCHLGGEAMIEILGPSRPALATLQNQFDYIRKLASM